MKRLVLPATFVVVLLAICCVCWTSEPPSLKDDIQFAAAPYNNPTIPMDGPVVIVPVETVSKQSSMDVTFLFRNTSLQPLRYLAKGEGPRAECPRDLYVQLFRDGQYVEPIKRPTKWLPVVADNVRTLKPGDYITYTLSLKDYAPDGDAANLAPGIYELRGGYEVLPNTLQHDLGCTPLSINRTIMLIDVVE